MEQMDALLCCLSVKGCSILESYSANFKVIISAGGLLQRSRSQPVLHKTIDTGHSSRMSLFM